jgi:hypothetical protein
VTVNAQSFAHDGAGAVTDGTRFSMSLDVFGTLTAGGQLLNRGQTLIKQESVPEPASLALLGVGVLGLGFLRSRKRQG